MTNEIDPFSQELERLSRVPAALHAMTHAHAVKQRELASPDDAERLAQEDTAETPEPEQPETQQ